MKFQIQNSNSKFRIQIQNSRFRRNKFQGAKIQKRNPDVCVPESQKSVVRKTPWGEMTYLEYKHRKIEEFNLSKLEFKSID